MYTSERGEGRVPGNAARTAGEVARLLGVAESTLRAWHRRYGVGPDAPRPGGYRRYADDDIQRLSRMRDLIRAGVLPSDAARRIGEEPGGAAPDRVLPDLLAAVRELDGRRCLTLLEEALAGSDVVTLWEDLCRPALTAVDADQRAAERHRAGACVEREHVLSWAITAALHGATARGVTGDGPAVLLACTDGEQHTLPLEALTAALTERGVPVRMLGAAVPTASLVHAVETTRPAAVVLWAQRPRTARADAVTALRRNRKLLAGPGWGERARRVTSLAGALDLLA